MSIDFSKVTAITTPSGSLSKINRTSDSVELWPNLTDKLYIIGADGKLNSSFKQAGYHYSNGYTSINREINAIQQGVTFDGLTYAGLYKYSFNTNYETNGAIKYIALPLTDTLKTQLKSFNKFHFDICVLFEDPVQSWTPMLGCFLTSLELNVSSNTATSKFYGTETQTIGGSSTAYKQSFAFDFSYTDSPSTGQTTNTLIIPINNPYGSGATYKSGTITLLYRNVYFSKD